jgi:hypothetical protein
MNLIQKEFLKGSQTFELGDNEIHVILKRNRERREFKIPFNVIGREPEISRYRDTFFLIVSIVFATLGAFFMFAVFTADTINTEGLGVGIFFMFFVAAISFHLHRRKNYDYFIYYNIFSGQPELVFWRDKPDTKTFSAFIEQFKKRLHVQNADYSTHGSGMAAEIHKLHELWEKGILSEEEFKAGKAKILGAEGEDWKY